MSVHQQAADLSAYTRCSEASSARVIAQYSTSFGMAVRLLQASIRPHVRNVYGLVRVADEIVDGAAAQAGLSTAAQRALLDALEAETHRAMHDGYSANLVVHAFARTARFAGIGTDLTAPFFASMRRDLASDALDAEQARDYIHGSAEVVGLMCVRVFIQGHTVDEQTRDRLEDGARRLGAAFQKINFLRDLAVDWQTLGRNYFPGIEPGALTEQQKLRIVADIDDDLAAAAAAIPCLPDGARFAVAAAYGLFAALTDRIRVTPAADLMTSRLRVPAMQKVGILARARLRGRRLPA